VSRLRTHEAQQVAELAVSLADADRLSRGRRYQRKGNVSGVFVAAGAATGQVDGSRSDPYEVTIAVRTANENIRQAVASGDLGAAVPRPPDVAISCVCPDWGDPCKHGVAVLLKLAQEIDDDLSLLLRWRGIDGPVDRPPPGTESLDDPRSRATSDPDSGDVRLGVVRDLRSKMGEDLADASDLLASDDDDGYGLLAEFFEGAMPADGSMPIVRLEEVQLEAFGSVRILLETQDAAPVIADAINTIADHWLGR
jgi:hypothetical protein